MKHMKQIMAITLSIICAVGNIYAYEPTVTKRAYNWFKNTAEKIQEYATSQAADENAEEYNNLYTYAGELATELGDISAMHDEITSNTPIILGIAGIYFTYKTYKTVNTLYTRFTR